MIDHLVNLDPLAVSILSAICAKGDPGLFYEVMDIVPQDAFRGVDRGTFAYFKRVKEAVQSGDVLPNAEGEPSADPIADSELLADLYHKRQLYYDLRAILCKLEDEGDTTSFEALLTRAENNLAATRKLVRETKDTQAIPLAEMIPEILQNIEAKIRAREAGQAVLGLPTGIMGLDNALGGLQPGLHILAASPGQGKTTFALQIAANVASQGVPVLFLSFDETKERLATKILCHKAGLVMKDYDEGRGDLAKLLAEWEKNQRELNPIHFMEGSPHLTTEQLKARAMQAMNVHRTDKILIVIDYIQRWASHRRDWTEFRNTVTALVGEIRSVALSLRCPVLGISDQNREGEGSADMASLGESRSLEYGADSITFLIDPRNNPFHKDQRTARQGLEWRPVDLVIRKNRYGSKDLTIKLSFHPAKARFEPA